MQNEAPISLITIIRDIEDPREERTRLHTLEDILVIGLCGMLCGAESFEEMEQFGYAKEEWFSTLLELPHGIPGHDTFNRVFAALDAGESPKVIVSAWAASNGLVPGPAEGFGQK
jgi:hypothetical protein